MNYQNVVRDFALRTRRNLVAIEAMASDSRYEVFETTQLVNSMLGLLIFPQQRYVDVIPKTPLLELVEQGWPIPKVRGEFRQVEDLNQLIRYLRNAVAHFNIKFVEDERGRIESLRIWNMAPVKDSLGKLVRDDNRKIVERKNWEADLGIPELRGIANRFIDLLLESP